LKNIGAVIANEKVGMVVEALKKIGVGGFTVVDDSLVDKVISAIIDAAGTGSAGDGKIFVTTIDDAIDIGSKQKGVHAI